MTQPLGLCGLPRTQGLPQHQARVCGLPLHIAGVTSYVAPSTDAGCLKPAHPASSSSQEYHDLKILARIVAGNSVDGWLLLTVMEGGWTASIVLGLVLTNQTREAWTDMR
jgi:hypothetical protein